MLLSATLTCNAQQIGLVATNAAFNGVACGIGAAIHHKPIIPAILIGAAAGTGNYYAKALVHDNYWIAKGCDAISVNVVQNVAAGRKPFEQFSLPIGFAQVNIEKGGVKAYLRPFSLISCGWLLSQSSTFDARTSIRVCGLVFQSGNLNSFTSANVIHLGSRDLSPVRLNQVMQHETIHTMQHNELAAWSSFQPLTKYHIWLDMPISSMLYELQPYKKNSFEKESYYLGEGINY